MSTCLTCALCCVSPRIVVAQGAGQVSAHKWEKGVARSSRGHAQVQMGTVPVRGHTRKIWRAGTGLPMAKGLPSSCLAGRSPLVQTVSARGHCLLKKSPTFFISKKPADSFCYLEVQKERQRTGSISRGAVSDA